MIIVGGTYREKCFEPEWDEIFGSGFRAVNVLLELDKNLEITYHTFGDKKTKKFLESISRIFPNLATKCRESKTFTFNYDYPLRSPFLSPWFEIGDIKEDLEIIVDNNEDLLLYGMIECAPIINAKNVVYDPQSPEKPISFISSGCKAEKLIYVCNFSEACKLAQSEELQDIVNYFFLKEKVEALLLKMGPKGALVYSDIENEPIKIPCYQTNKVWKIGTGDIFSSVFSYYYFKGETLELSASNASKYTAIYSEFQTLRIADYLKNYDFNPLIFSTKTNKKQVYLAGPFFTFNQRWLVNEIRSAMLDMGLKVFSPFHDVGFDKKIKQIVKEDINGIDQSSVLFAIVDGLDSGTLFEIGYAISKGIKVICYNQNEIPKSLLMLEGSDCIFEDDLTSAIYKTSWLLNKEENE